MVKAVVSRGEIRPLEPLPADWREGQPLRVEKADDSEMPVEEIDRDFAVLANLCSESEPANEDQLDRALHEARRQAKEQVRRHMGLEYCQTAWSTAIICRLRCARSRRCASAFTTVAGRAIVLYPATPFSVSWKLGFSRPRSRTKIVAGWPSCCATCACGPWMPRLPVSTAQSTSNCVEMAASCRRWT